MASRAAASAEAAAEVHASMPAKTDVEHALLERDAVDNTRPQDSVKTTATSTFLDRLPDWVFKFILLAATMVWGFAFVVMKDSLNVYPPAQLVGVRFIVAALLMLVFFYRNISTFLGRKTIGVGLLLGVLYFIAYWSQTVGLDDTTPGKNAFLTAAYVVIVPFVFWLISRKSPSVYNIIAAVVCLVGIGFVSLNEALTIGFGDGMTLVSAVFFALHMACIAYFADECDIFTITFIQFLIVGILGLAIGIPLETGPSLDQVLNPTFIGQIAYLIILSTFLASLAQNVGQTRVPASQAALILSLESVFGVLASVWVYGEQLTVKMVIGFALIFIAVLISEGLAGRKAK